MRNRELWHFVILTIKCFIIIIIIGIFLPKVINYLLQNLINNTKIYKNSIAVNKLVNINHEFIYNYIRTFYLFFKG